jgi:crossover junction endodeoxyribonuclease RuvC
MPGQGVSSVWTFGHSVGVIHGVVAALGLRLELVSPAKWKGHFNLGRDKEASRIKAIQKYPGVTGLELKKHSDRAEALLIATFYQETNHDRQK